MEQNVILSLFNNAALLLVLSVAQELVYYLPSGYRRWYPVISGLLIASICLAVMSLPFRFQPGINYDTRSILISVTAFILGPVPAAITTAAAAGYRVYVGGSGIWAGLATIFSSALIGLIWRRWVHPKWKGWRWLSVLWMSVCVHLAMLACQMLLPYPDNLRIVRAIFVPVILIYPAATVLLCQIIFRQQAFRQNQLMLTQSEERFRLLFDKAPLGYQSLDINGCFIEVNRQWCDLLGYTRDEVIGKWFGDFLSPANREAFRLRFPVFKAQGYVHSEFEVLQKNGEPKFIAFEGRIGYEKSGEFKQTHCILQDITSQKAAEAALIESENKYRSIAENVSDVVWQMDLNLNTIYISPSVSKLLGESPEEHMKRGITEKFSEDSIRLIQAMLMEELEHEKDPRADKNRSRTIEVEHFKADGSPVMLEMNISFLRDEQGKVSGLLGVSRDITLRKKAEQSLAESERSKSVLLSNLQGMAYRCSCDRDRTMRFVSSGCLELTGYTPEDLVNSHRISFNDLIAPEYRDLLRDKWEQCLAKRQPFRFEYELVTAQNKRIWVLEIGQGVYNDQGGIEALEGIIVDISDRKAIENHLIYVNEHDKLTGLYNREYLETLLKRDVRKKDGKKRAVISVNLSMVRLLAANYGFHYTQKLIQNAAETMKPYCADNRMLFQTYDNSFVFYLTEYRDGDELLAFCESIAAALESLFTTDRISGGIGILELSASESDLDVGLILRRLLIASERSIAVSEKDIAITFYNQELEAIVNRERDIRHALSASLTDEPGYDMYLQYQPIYDIALKAAVGFEALARLRTKDLGAVSPVEFIPIAEKTKLIIPLGEKVFLSAFEFSNTLKQLGYSDMNISVNVSAIQLLRPGFAEWLSDLMEINQADPGNIGIELTESIFTSDYTAANRTIEKLKALGVTVAIDDFGTGYSSLSREKELKVDCLKIDKSFIDQLMVTEPDKAIAGDIISMAHKQGHYVIAEGVEYEQQMRYLTEHGCDRIQGYLIARPLDVQDAIAFLSSPASD